MSKNSVLDYAKALFEATDGLKGKELSEALAAFASLLSRHNMITRVPHVIKAYESYAKKQQGVVSINITTAREVEKTTLEHIKKAFGDKVEATHDIDAKLIGGLVVRTDDMIFDASLKMQLQKLKQILV